MRIEQTFDCTHKELVLDIAAIIYATHDARLPEDKPNYLWESQHPTERSVLWAAEEIFEIFYGDSPDYSEEE